MFRGPRFGHYVVTDGDNVREEKSIVDAIGASSNDRYHVERIQFLAPGRSPKFDEKFILCISETRVWVLRIQKRVDESRLARGVGLERFQRGGLGRLGVVQTGRHGGQEEQRCLEW